MFTESIKKSILNIISQNPLTMFALGVISIGFATGKGLEVTTVVAVLYTLFRQGE